jgi:hypothetical protein
MKTKVLIWLFLFPFLSSFSQTEFQKAPLYWSVYEYHIEKEIAGDPNNYIPESVFQSNINWVKNNLQPLGYNMICVDGWGDVSQLSPNGYRASHSENWEHNFAWWADYLQQQDMNLGMYGNPLWIHVDVNDLNTLIPGTYIPVSSLIDPDEEAAFTWVQIDRPGAEEYVKGYINYYGDMGIKYFRIDFLSWYENGWDRYLGTVGPERPRSYYETALQWMREAADEHDMFLSLVMPHLYFEAEAEKEFGDMFRINEDTGEGGWWKWSEKDRGIKREGWSVYANAFDGLTYWSGISGRDSVKLDPDFIRINTFTGFDEKKSVVSLCLLAGGALTVSDQYNTIGTDLWLYQNTELLALHEDGFVGKPLTNDPTDPESQVWKGQLSNGDWIVGLFNRENNPQERSIDFTDLGIYENAQIRDLWMHENLENATSFSATIPPHGCRILKVVPASGSLTGPESMYVQYLATEPQNIGNGLMSGKAMVTVMDSDDNPVEGALVTVKFSGSFNEEISGNTGMDGNVILNTTLSDTGIVKINACVINVSHPEYIYAGDKNTTTCVGETIYYAGTYNDWNLKTMNYSQGWWRKDSVVMTSGVQEMKFANTNNWSGTDWGDATGLSGFAIETTGGGPNISFTIFNGGFFDISFNDTSHQYFVDESEVKKLNSEMYVAGTFNDWTLIPMAHDGENWAIEYQNIPSGNQELKFANTSNWSGDDWGNATGLEGIAKIATGGDPNISFYVPESREYKILFDDICLEYAIISALGVNNYQSQEVFIHPNPTNGKLYIEHQKQTDFIILIYNTDGRKVLESSNQQYLDIGSFDNGIYLIRIISDNQTITRKILKVD